MAWEVLITEHGSKRYVMVKGLLEWHRQPECESDEWETGLKKELFQREVIQQVEHGTTGDKANHARPPVQEGIQEAQEAQGVPDANQLK